MSTDEQKLTEIRQRIDAIDKQIHDLLNQRARCAQDVAEVKLAALADNEAAPVFYRPEREAQVLRAVIERNDGPLPGDQVAHIFREIMSSCLALEQPLRIAYLGPKGTFTQAAAIKHFGHSGQVVPYASVDRIFAAVENDDCGYGVVPVENSTEGMVNHTLDCLANSALTICGEVEIPIVLHLLGVAGSELSSIKKICAHQQALAQARGWLDSHCPDIERIEVASNGEAARMAAETEGVAAIAGELAVSAYNLEVIEKNIQDREANTTRFLVVAKQSVPMSGADKTTIMVSARNEPGALLNLLKPFEEAGINMTRLTSRPSHTENWAYVFFMEFEGHESDPVIKSILSNLEAKSYAIKLLGSFPVAVF